MFHRTGRHTTRSLGQAALPASEIPAVAAILNPPASLRTDTVQFPAIFLTAATAR